MYRVIDGKDTGKTRKLLTECGKTNGLYVCRHPNGITDKCLAYGIPVVTAIGYEDFLNSGFRNGHNIYIDELELFVQTMLPYLAGYTLSKED